MENLATSIRLTTSLILFIASIVFLTVLDPTQEIELINKGTLGLISGISWVLISMNIPNFK